MSKSKKVNEAIISFSKILPELSLSSDGIITRGQRIMLPKSLQETAISAAHAGHPGINSVKRHLRAKYCFAGMDLLVQEHVGACHACNVNTDKTNQEPLRPTVSPKEAWGSGVTLRFSLHL